ncbi:MAG: SH3 domain-containing protein, partial [Chloroflexota bacterium]
DIICVEVFIEPAFGCFNEDFDADNVITEADQEDSALLAASIDDAPDWLDEISGIDTDTLKEAARQTNEMQGVDVDALIDSFGDEEGELDPATASAVNLNAVLAQLDEEQRSQLPDDLNADELPEWLREIATQTDADSAVAVIRSRNDRSLDDLDDRLLNLHQQGLELTPQTTQSAADKERLAKIVPNIDDVLTPAAVTPGQTTLVTDPILSPEQAERVALLQNLVGSSVTTEAQAEATSTPQGVFQFFYTRLDRVIIALMLLAAVLSPFVYPAFSTIGSLPPNDFATESPEFAAFALIDDTEPEDFVLIAAEYGATGARELDTATRTFMEHIITNGGTPIIVSSNAIGILRAENIAVDLLGEESANDDYYVGGFLPAGTIGLRDFVLNASSVLATDVRGQPTGLALDSLEDFSAIVLISESGETVRNWMEQVAPSTDTSIVVVTGQAARPLALPYVSSVDNAVALLAGYDDSFTYQQMVLGAYNPSPTPAPSDTPVPTATNTSEATATDAPTDTPAPSDTPEPTEEPADDADDEESEANAAAADDDADEEEAVDEADEETEAPTPTEEPTATPTEEPTATESPTDTPMPSPSPTPNTIIVAQVVAADTVNIRAGAGSNFALIGSAEPGDYLPLNNANTLQDDWINIQLLDGTEGWVASFLVEIVEIEDTELEAQRAEDDTVRIATIVGEGRVNVRSGPGETFESIAGLDVGSEVRVIGESDDGGWVNVILPNEVEGWVASFLTIIEERPAAEWDGASREGFFPIYFSRGQTVSQDDDADVPTVTTGTNVAGFAIPLYADVELTTEIGTVAALEQVLVLDELPDEEASFVQLETTAQGYVETRLLRIEDVPADSVDFVQYQDLFKGG